MSLVPGPPDTVVANLAARARHRPDVPALVDEQSGAVSYAELWAVTERVGTGLVARGLARGSRVAVAMNPSAAYVALVFGAMRAGLVPVPLNTRLAPDEVATFLEPIRPDVVVADDEHAQWVAGAGVPVEHLVEGGTEGPLLERLGVLARDGDPGAAPAEEEPAVIFSTGGTTGTPKGAVSTHRSLARWTSSVAQSSLRSSETVEAYFSPFFHVSLITGLMTTLWVGGTVRVLDRFDAGRVLEAIDAGATFLQGAPTMYVALRNHPRFAATDRSGVRDISFGSAASTEDFARQLMADYPRARLKTGYGATEFGPVTRVGPDDFAAGRFSGVGFPVSGATVRIVGPDGSELPPGEVGEIAVSCPWQTAGYWGRAAETATTWSPVGIRLGDLGRQDGDGWLTVVGRTKEMVVTGGENVFPAEVEAALAKHPGVAEVVVYGADDDYWGERVEAVVVPAGPEAVDPEELRRYLRGRIGSYKIPRVILVAEEIPLTSNHKPDRQALRRRAAARSE